jgi:hypothetical protein
MLSRSVRRIVIAALATVAVAAATPRPAAAQNAAGYVVFDGLSETVQYSGNVIILSGTIRNLCTASLPSGATLEFRFDGVPFASFGITALANGQEQQFSVYSTLPSNLPAPKRNVTSLDFAIVLPKQNRFDLRGEDRTSPCLVSLAPGTPSH